MPFRTAANIDRGQTHGLIISNASDNSVLVATGAALTNSQPMHVALVDGTGTQITTTGGTQYTEADIDTTITGTALMWEDAADTLRAVSASKPLPVDIQDASVVVDTEFPAAAAITDNFANPTTTNIMSMGMLWDGATWDRAKGDSTDGALVNLGSNNDVIQATPTNLKVQIFGDDTTSALNTDASGDLQVDVLTMPSVTVDSEFPTAAAITDAFANPTTTSVMAMGMGWNGTTWDRLKSDTTNGLDVDVTRVSGSVAVTGTFWQATQPISAASLPLPTGASTSANQSTANTSLANIDTDTTAIQTSVELIDDIIVAQGTALGTTKVGLLAGSVTTAAPTFTTGQINQLSLTTSGALRVDLGATSANATAVKVDGSAVTQPVSGTVSITANSAVNVAQINGVTPLMGAGNTGTGSPRVTIATDQAAVATTPAGNVAHDAADSGNPIKIGAKVETSPKGITLPIDGDRTDLYADSDGMLMVKNHTSNADTINERIADTAGTSAAFTNFSAVASTFNYVTTIAVYNSSATNGYVDIRDGTAGAILFTVPAPTVGGSVITFPVPLRQPTANTALAYDVSGALTTVYISVVGFQSKV